MAKVAAIDPRSVVRSKSLDLRPISEAPVTFNWTCPYCQRDQVVTDQQVSRISSRLHLAKNRFTSCGVFIIGIACSNENCGDVTLAVNFGKGTESHSTGRFILHDGAEHFPLRPASCAKPQPSCVPSTLASDYNEACAIRDLSPKASATLSRRVLQGMIRNFCGIAKGRLVDEIDELKKQADAGTAPAGVALETIDAMHHVRSLGNIGAHMEKDINVVVDVDPGEAQQLIDLIEMLFKDWYVARDSRQKRLDALKGTAEQKAVAKSPGKSKGSQT